MRSFVKLAAIAAVLGLAGCAGKFQQVYDERIDETYAVGGGEYSTGPRIYVFAKLAEANGNTVICGAWARESANAAAAGADLAVLEGTRIIAGGETVLSGVEKLPQRRFRSNMRNALAYCFLTDKPWKEAYGQGKPVVQALRYQSRKSRLVVAEFIPGPLPEVIK